MRQTLSIIGISLALCAAATAQADSQPRTRDGFHFQATGGLGYYNVSGGAPAKQSFSGLTLPSSLFFGGTLFGHLALGGGMILDYAPSPTYKQNGTKVSGQVTSQMILGLGLYGDYYLNPQANGLHIQVFAGWGGLGAGYDWWISDQWSAGVLGRFLYAPIALNSTKFPTYEPAVVGVLTWH
jgi:hypothetical protein